MFLTFFPSSKTRKFGPYIILESQLRARLQLSTNWCNSLADWLGTGQLTCL